MSDDKKVSRLISKSLHGDLTTAESVALDKHMDGNEESKKFAELSRVIQDSVSLAAETIVSGDSENQMSAELKDRLKASIASASAEKQRLSQAGLISDSRVIERTQNLESEESTGAGDSDERRGVSRFKLLRELGQGGLGNVWLARDEKLNRNVAIKELNANALTSPKAWQRFQREAEITGRLEHPNIISLYQYGDDRTTGEPFYAMRFVGKRTLADAIVEYHDRVEAGEDAGLGLHRMLAVFLDVCQAIAYAHSRGVVHRDLKPENVALDRFGEVVVLDWGLAKLIEDGEFIQKMSTEANMNDSSLHQTMEGDVVGTPLYMAPEQAVGDLDKVDRQTDVFGLGAMLFAMLTGHAPHQKTLARQEGAGLKDLLKLIATSEPPKITDYRSDVASALEVICQKSMSRKRHLRYESVEDLAEAVERWMAGQSGKKARYEKLRMEGRELRADLQSFVNDLERNVRFMSHLPPIQEIIAAEDDEEFGVWRSRLTTIYRGLLEANSDYTSVMYSRVEGGTLTEIVRVERHSKDSSSIRAVPRSRLRDVKVNEYISALTEQKPEEVVTSLVNDPTCESEAGCAGEDVGLVAGMPVYDDRTEECFGVIMIEGDIDRVLRRQFARPLSATDVAATCDVFGIMMRKQKGQIESGGAHRITETAPHFQAAAEALQNELEFIDETNGDIYGARIWFIPDVHGMMYLLKGKS